jgi:hypothetical protein
MKTLGYGLIFILVSSHQLFSKDELSYPVSQIPEKLKNGMYAVVREKHERFEIVSINQSKYYCRQVITILNSRAKRLAMETIGYDKLIKLDILTARSYDAEGRLIKKLKSNEIKDYSAFDGFSLFSDNRYKILDLTHAIYPYTIEIEYETISNYLYSIPAFVPYFDDEVSSQLISYELIYPVGLRPKHKLVNVSEPMKIVEGTTEKLVWRLTDLVPEKFERYAPSSAIPKVMFSPNSFEYSGYKGSMETWERYGEWHNLLNKGRGELAESTKVKIRELTGNLTSDKEKAKVIYEYLQNKTRYVSIQEGIGGLQPFSAGEVDATGYGDCKALSNYYVAMLKEAGIKGYYTKVWAGENKPLILDFPSHQTNHIIVAIPSAKDTLWAECTSQRSPFGYMGSFTGDRWALMVTESGGKLVRTPSYGSDQNQKRTHAEVFIDVNGNARANVKTTYSGILYETGGLNNCIHTSTEDQKKWIEENTNIPAFEISSFAMKGTLDKNPSVHVTMDLVANRYSSVSGKRLFLMPNLMNRSTYLPEKTESRKHSIIWPLAYTIVDSVTFRLPENLYPEFVPEPIKINSRFGQYENAVKFDQGEIIYTRRFKLNKGEFPAESYTEFMDFYKSVNKSDNLKLVFLNKS